MVFIFPHKDYFIWLFFPIPSSPILTHLKKVQTWMWVCVCLVLCKHNILQILANIYVCIYIYVLIYSQNIKILSLFYKEYDHIKYIFLQFTFSYSPISSGTSFKSINMFNSFSFYNCII